MDKAGVVEALIVMVLLLKQFIATKFFGHIARKCEELKWMWQKIVAMHFA